MRQTAPAPCLKAWYATYILANKPIVVPIDRTHPGGLRKKIFFKVEKSFLSSDSSKLASVATWSLYGLLFTTVHFESNVSLVAFNCNVYAYFAVLPVLGCRMSVTKVLLHLFLKSRRNETSRPRHPNFFSLNSEHRSSSRDSSQSFRYKRVVLSL